MAVLEATGHPHAKPRTVARPRAVAIGAVLLLHAALIAWMQHAWHRADTHRDQHSTSLRMVTIQLPPLPKEQPKAQPRTTLAARPSAGQASPDPGRPPPAAEPGARPAARDAAPPSDKLRPEDRPEDARAEQPRSMVVVVAPSPASAASGPTGRDLLYGAATQRAVRQATQGQPLLAERMDQASLAPEKDDASAKLGKEMMKGATGDCMKGEFAGGGAGLLSLPFWVLAEARGKCRR